MRKPAVFLVLLLVGFTYQRVEAGTREFTDARTRPSPSASNATRPHIVMIVADDLGWNDVGWRDDHMHSPTLDKLAKEGVILNQHYVQPVCSPSRAAFMSGYYPYHLGMQHESLRATQKAYLPANITTLPQHLKDLGYITHMAGKWHLGFCNWRYTPTYRGFDSFVGYYNAIEHYFTHLGHRHGYDFRENEDVFYAAKGVYSAFVFTQYIEQVIKQHDDSKPLFVYLPYQSVHGPLEVPQDYIDKYCSHIQNDTRRTRCGMVAALDEGVANITRALQTRGLYNDTLILFTTDNGGPVPEGSNNWPLRGSKTTLWEGGTRAVSFLHSPKLLSKVSGTTYEGIIHAVDWLPTLLEAAGGSAPPEAIDGVSQWQSVLQAKVPSARTEFVYNFDEMKKNAGLRQGNFKLLQGPPGEPSGWYPPPSGDERLPSANPGPTRQLQVPLVVSAARQPPRITFGQGNIARLVTSSEAGDSLTSPEYYGGVEEEEERDRILFADELAFEQEDGRTSSSEEVSGKDTYLLFDLEADPNEHVDVQAKYPDVFKQMVARLEEYRKSLVPANWPPHDPASFPENFNGTWSPGWCD